MELYNNKTRFYRGSENDWLLNKNIDRYRADYKALKSIRNYETSGNLKKPLIMLHNSGDHIAPIWHQDTYAAKVARKNKSSKLSSASFDRYSHTLFDDSDLISALEQLKNSSGSLNREFIKSKNCDKKISEQFLKHRPIYTTN